VAADGNPAELAIQAAVGALPSAAQNADAMWNEARADHVARDSFGKVGDWAGSGVNVTLGAVTSVREPGNRLSAPVTLEMWQQEIRAFSLTVLDAAGLRWDMSGKTLKFVVQESEQPADGLFRGLGRRDRGQRDDNEVVTVTVAAGVADTAGDDFYWLLRDSADVGTGSGSMGRSGCGRG